jgi:hypothetical protein
MVCRATVEWAYAPPAGSSASAHIASMISSGLALGADELGVSRDAGGALRHVGHCHRDQLLGLLRQSRRGRGSRYCGVVGMGTVAEVAAVDTDAAAQKPASIDLVEAASLPVVALTTWQALVEIGRLQPRQRVLVRLRHTPRTQPCRPRPGHPRAATSPPSRPRCCVPAAPS